MARRDDCWYQQLKASLLDQLRRSRRPLTTGELFLLLKESHTMINKLLKELRDEGLVSSEVHDAISTNCAGGKFKHPARHWAAVPLLKSKPREMK